MTEQSLLEFVQNYPWIAKLVFWAGAARLILKWVSGWLQKGMDSALLRMSEDQEGYEMVKLGLKNWAYRTFAFIVDLTCSVKLPTFASFQAHHVSRNASALEQTTNNTP